MRRQPPIRPVIQFASLNATILVSDKRSDEFEPFARFSTDASHLEDQRGSSSMTLLIRLFLISILHGYLLSDRPLLEGCVQRSV